MTHSRLELLVLGDWGRGGTEAQRAVAEGMAKVAESHDAAAVLTTGDNFYDDGVRDLADAHWIKSFEDVYTHDALQVPWWPTLGNHDHRGRVDAQIAYSRRDRRWNLPQAYHSRLSVTPDGTRVQTLFLDTAPFVGLCRSGGAERIPGIERYDTDRQLAWVERRLAETQADWRIVVGHHPIHSGSPYHGGAVELQERLLPLLRAGGVHLYLAGHEHDQQHLVDGDLHLVVTGAAAERRPTGRHEKTVFCDDGLGFASLGIDRDALRVRLHSSGGRLLHHTTIQADAGRRQRRPRGRPVTVLP